MKLEIRQLKKAILALSLATIAAALPGLASAQSYPSKQIRLVVPFAAGGATDVIARVVADSLRDDLKQPVVIENLAGASGGIGAQNVSGSTPDGHTIMVMANGMLAAPFTVKAYAGFDPRTALTPIAYLAESPIVGVVPPSVPAKNFREFIEYVKANPGKFNYAASGGSVDLDVGLFMSRAGLKMEKISYKGAAPVVTALLQNEVQFATGSPLSLRGQLDSGRVRAIGVMSSRPWPGDASLRVASESVPGYEMVPGWFGVMGPKGLPRSIVDIISSAARGAVNKPANKKRLEDAGMYVYDAGPDDMAQNIQRTLETWREGVKVTGIQPE